MSFDFLFKFCSAYCDLLSLKNSQFLDWSSPNVIVHTLQAGNSHRKQALLDKYLFQYELTKVNKKAYSFIHRVAPLYCLCHTKYRTLVGVGTMGAMVPPLFTIHLVNLTKISNVNQ